MSAPRRPSSRQQQQQQRPPAPGRPSGQGCSIFDLIDALPRAATAPELARALRPILTELAVFAVTEGGVASTLETWHGDYTAALAAEAEGQQQQQQPGPPGGPASAPFASFAPQREQRPAKHSRGHRTPLPSSLRAIRDGTHASLFED